LYLNKPKNKNKKFKTPKAGRNVFAKLQPFYALKRILEIVPYEFGEL
jgi:hypothetical protein